MRLIKLYIIPLFFLVLFTTSCKETLEIDNDDLIESVQAPQVEEFSPATGSAGTQITLTGKGFATADSVLINGVKTQIKNRISDSSMIIELTGMESSGKIKVFNSKGNGESSESFAVVYKQPEDVQVGINTGEVLVSGMLLDITGKNLQVVRNIFLSGSTDRRAKILFQNDDKITIEVPVICDPQAAIKLEYYQQSAVKYWISEKYDTDKVILPPVIEKCPQQAYVGQTIYIEATNADRIDSVYFQEKNLPFELVSETSIRVVLPNTYTSPVTGELSIMHNACEEEVIVPEFKIIIPLCYANFDLYLTAQGGNGGSTGANATNAFYDAEHGGTYTTCEAVDHPRDIEFITYSNGNGGFVFYGPHALNANTIKNFYCGTAALSTLMDMAQFNGVTVKFRRLDPEVETQKALIDKFNNNEIIEINADLFNGISAPASNNIAYYKYNTGYTSGFTPGDVIWFQNSATNKNGLMRVNSVNYSGTAQDKFSSALADILYQK